MGEGLFLTHLSNRDGLGFDAPQTQFKWKKLRSLDDAEELVKASLCGSSPRSGVASVRPESEMGTSRVTWE